MPIQILTDLVAGCDKSVSEDARLKVFDDFSYHFEQVFAFPAVLQHALIVTKVESDIVEEGKESI